ncbi:MAG: hypothetical protein C4547_02105 [Phycisphaerales bacterium]|nr:MAG: hypothetical protein C4547_02105 [Phycisphaerales bacterium]
MSTTTTDRSKDAVARRLAESHYRIDPAIERIVRLISPEGEDAPSEPIKLLEVNTDTSMSGILPVYFGPHPDSGIFFASIIVEVRPEEFARIEGGELTLPDGWRAGEAYLKPADNHL